MGLTTRLDGLLGFAAPVNAAKDEHATEAAVQVARSWAGLTSQGRILISVEQLEQGQDVNVLLAHESVHDILIEASALGVQQLVLSVFGMPPMAEFSLSGMLRRMLARTVRGSVRVQEGCATFLPSLGRDANGLAAYLTSLPAEYRDLVRPLEWLRARKLDQDVMTRLVFIIGQFSLGVRLPAETLSDPAALGRFLQQPDNNPNERFAVAMTGLQSASDADLARLAQMQEPETGIAQRWYAQAAGHPGPYTGMPGRGPQWVAAWRELVTEMVSAWTRHPRITEPERGNLTEMSERPELLLQVPAPSVLKAMLTHTVADSGLVADHPRVGTLLPYELASISYNSFPGPVPGVEKADGTSLPLAPGEAALWLASPSRPGAAVRLSTAGLREYLSAAGPDATICVYDGGYMLAWGDVLGDKPLFRDRFHIVLVQQRFLGALINLDLDMGLAGQTDLRYTIVGGEIPGVSYFLVAPKNRPSPVVVAPAPWPTTDRARQELRRGGGRSATWTEAEPAAFLDPGSARHLLRLFAWFENKPWPPGTERAEGPSEGSQPQTPQETPVDKPSGLDLGPPPDSRGRDSDAIQNLNPAVRRQLDKAGKFESRGDFARAHAGYTKMMTSSDPQARAAGSIALGMMLTHRFDPPGAARAYQVAAGSSDPDLAPLALLYTGQALRGAGDVPGAVKALAAAAATRHPGHAPPAAYCLGQVYTELGADPARARAAELFEWAVASQHPGVWPLAAVELAKIYLASSRQDDALRLLERVLSAGHRQAQTEAAQLIVSVLGR